MASRNFRVTLQQTPLPRPQATDSTSGSVLSLECPMNAESAVINVAPFASVELSVSAGTGTETDETAITVSAVADRVVVGDQSVDLGVSGAGITGSDFTLSANTITVSDGTTTGAVTFTVVNDAELEPDETATLTIGNPSAGIELGATTSQDIVITDNDSPPVVQPAVFITGSPQNGDIVGQVEASDPDDNIPATGAFAIIAGNNGGAFAIQDDGTLVVNNAGALGVPSTVSLTVEVTDAEGLADSAVVEIRIGEIVFEDGFESP